MINRYSNEKSEARSSSESIEAKSATSEVCGFWVCDQWIFAKFG